MIHDSWYTDSLWLDYWAEANGQVVPCPHITSVSCDWNLDWPHVLIIWIVWQAYWMVRLIVFYSRPICTVNIQSCFILFSSGKSVVQMSWNVSLPFLLFLPNYWHFEKENAVESSGEGFSWICSKCNNRSFELLISFLSNFNTSDWQYVAYVWLKTFVDGDYGDSYWYWDFPNLRSMSEQIINWTCSLILPRSFTFVFS